MKLLMIGHLLGDFYFQTNKLAEKKKTSFAYTVLHGFVYSLVMFVVLVITTGKLVECILPTLLIGVLHLVVDGVKCGVQKCVKSKKYELSIFMIDQIIHFGILFAISCLYTIKCNISWIPGIPENLLSSMQGAPIIILAFLLCGKPAAIIVSLVFGLIPKTIEKANFESVKIIDGSNKENVRIGSWIGILEREIILILGLLGQYGAIGFVIAAKSLARHSQLNEPAFAEKYLIGTLLSSFMALLGIMMCKVL